MFAQKTHGPCVCDRVFAGREDGCCWGCLCVSMVLTEVDNCSNDCGGSGGSPVSAAGCRQCGAARLDVSQPPCLFIT